MLKTAATILIFLTTLPAYSMEPSDTVIKGVRIRFDYSRNIFPDSWQQPPINAAGEPLQVSEIDRCKKILNAALEKYPVNLLEKELRHIYFIKAMKFYDVGYGGTNSTDALYLTNNGSSMGYTDHYVEQTFHHEFSSILYRNHSALFREAEWKRSNAAGVSYTDPENGVGAIRDNRSSQDFDTLLCQKGFLTQYASSGLENDLNTIAQNLFSPSEGFWDIVDRYPRIQRKVRLLVSFYNRIHPVFSIDYFRKFKE